PRDVSLHPSAVRQPRFRLPTVATRTIRPRRHTRAFSMHNRSLHRARELEQQHRRKPMNVKLMLVIAAASTLAASTSARAEVATDLQAQVQALQRQLDAVKAQLDQVT